MTLALALGLAGLALGAGLWGRYRLGRLGSRRTPALARGMALAALGVGALSVVVHLAFGHRPWSPTALTFTAFLAEHPAFLVVAVAAGLALAVAKPAPAGGSSP